jgi:hypothetical protein
MISNATILHELLKNELGLFHYLHVKSKFFVLPLIWWKSHEAKFPNVFFVVQKILRILRSKIEIKKFFSIAKVLTNLQCHRLGVDILDKLVMILKNWSTNARSNCS